eukprot:1188021-Prorocentrum_minimum.AAC.1
MIWSAGGVPPVETRTPLCKGPNRGPGVGGVPMIWSAGGVPPVETRSPLCEGPNGGPGGGGP